MRGWSVIVAGALLLCLSACVSPNEVAMSVGAPPTLAASKAAAGQKPVEGKLVAGQQSGGQKGAVSLRSLQTRRFDTGDQSLLLLAATQTLQDLGFTVNESSVEAGVLVASKQRDAEEEGQVAGQVALTVLLALLGTYHNPTWDKEQSIYVTLVTGPLESGSQCDLRVSFDRRMTNNRGLLWRSELLHDEKLYQEFFNKLSEGLFLEAQQV